MDLSQTGEKNGVLLALSAILQGNNTVAQLSELMAQIETDLETDGTVASAAIHTEILDNSQFVNANTVKAHLLARYAALGVPRTLPDFEQFIDTNGDGDFDDPKVSVLVDFTNSVSAGDLGMLLQQRAVDSNGNIYLIDSPNSRVLLISPSGAISVFAGSGATLVPDLKARGAVTIDAQDNLYFYECSNCAPPPAALPQSPDHRIRKITAGGADSVLATLPSSLRTLSIDSNGNLFGSIGGTGMKFLKIAPNGTVTDFAGSGIEANTDGTGAGASFVQIFSTAIDSGDNIWLVDGGCDCIRKITPAGVVTTQVDNAKNYLGVVVNGNNELFVLTFISNKYAIQKFSPTLAESNYIPDIGDFTLHFSDFLSLDSSGILYTVESKRIIKIAP